MLVSKWGKRLLARLIKALPDKFGLAAGGELKVVDARNGTFAVEKIDRRAEFLKQMEQFRWPVSESYRFNRDQANEQ